MTTGQNDALESLRQLVLQKSGIHITGVQFAIDPCLTHTTRNQLGDL
jgi:hypothetical protein